MLNDFNICVIGLKARADRWKRCKEVLSDAGVKKVTYWSTVQNYEDSYKGYMTDFLNMLSHFRGKPLMFFEDDFELTDNWREVLKEALKELPQTYDILYLGANLQEPVTRAGNHLVRVYGAWLMHATLLSPKFIEDILLHYPPANIRIIDEWYRKIAKTREFFMTYPMISYQRKDYSDFVGQYVYYDIFSNKYYTRAYENFRNAAPIPTASQCGCGVDGSRDEQVSGLTGA